MKASSIKMLFGGLIDIKMDGYKVLLRVLGNIGFLRKNALNVREKKIVRLEKF